MRNNRLETLVEAAVLARSVRKITQFFKNFTRKSGIQAVIIDILQLAI